MKRKKTFRTPEEKTAQRQSARNLRQRRTPPDVRSVRQRDEGRFEIAQATGTRYTQVLPSDWYFAYDEKGGGRRGHAEHVAQFLRRVEQEHKALREAA